MGDYVGKDENSLREMVSEIITIYTLRSLNIPKYT